jgi:hypothetical protein
MASVRYFEVSCNIDSEWTSAKKVAFKSDSVFAEAVGWCAKAYKKAEADILYFAQIFEAGAAAYKILGAFHLRNDLLNFSALTFSQLHGRAFSARTGVTTISIIPGRGICCQWQLPLGRKIKCKIVEYFRLRNKLRRDRSRDIFVSRGSGFVNIKG